MKALFVINNPGYGGGYNQIVRLREPLAERGWEVALVAPENGEAVPRVRAEGVEVIEMPLHRLRASPDPRLQVPFVWSFRREVLALRRTIAQWGADVVQPHGDTNPHAALAAHGAGVAVAWQLYDTRTPVALRSLTMPVVTRVADVIMTVGDALADAYPGARRLGDRCITIWPPVDDLAFAPAPERRAAARQELGIPDDAVAVGAIGMLNPSKGFEYFIRALAQARAAGAPVVGRILGAASPGHPEYLAAVQAEARALGLLDGRTLDMRDGGTRIAELMPAFDVLALSSVPRSEGLPTVILEAMACGVPVVATDVAAVAEAVAHGETGWVVPSLDAEAMAARFVELARDPGQRRRFGDAGAARFAGRFSIDRLADRYVHVYETAYAFRRDRR